MGAMGAMGAMWMAPVIEKAMAESETTGNCEFSWEKYGKNMGKYGKMRFDMV
jgi:hypothetical protein